MANNKKNKKKAQGKADQAAADAKLDSKKAASKGKSAKASKKAKKDAKPGFFARTKKYFSQVRSEMKRVTWPTKKELGNLSVVVIVSLVIVGLAIAGIDALVAQGLVLFSGLRG